jgi:GntR family transcriptional regulator, transcriptional repressor for pyruvate dehydrogenase complex
VADKRAERGESATGAVPARSQLRSVSAPADGRALPISTGDAVYRPLKTAEAFARDLVRDIVNKGLRTGDKLPSEAVMLEEFGLSRESLREGLRLLEVQGLITIRRGPGGGPIVGHLDPASLGRTSTLYYHLAGGTYAELMEAWVVTETILAERAARNPDRDAVREAMEPYRVPPPADDEGLTQFVLAHTHFHGVLASLVENRVLEMMLQTIGQIVTHHVLGHADPRHDREQIEADHAAIATAVAAGAPQKAAKAMERHIETMIEVYKEDLGAQLHEFIDWI